MRGAVAVWVKTPGLSPVKTRLAASIGAAAAEQFYRLSVEAVRGVVRAAVERSCGGLVPYWAVAEADAEGWPEFGTVRQGEGGLGERLAHVYDALLERHRYVVFLGADSPQLTPEPILRAAGIASAGRFAIGPADDGGFYLFGGSRRIPRQVWLSPPYSSPDTLHELEAGLAGLGQIDRLPELFDVDTVDELRRLRAEWTGGKGLLAEQRALREWLEG